MEVIEARNELAERRNKVLGRAYYTYLREWNETHDVKGARERILFDPKIEQRLLMANGYLYDNLPPDNRARNYLSLPTQRGGTDYDILKDLPRGENIAGYLKGWEVLMDEYGRGLGDRKIDPEVVRTIIRYELTPIQSRQHDSPFDNVIGLAGIVAKELKARGILPPDKTISITDEVLELLLARSDLIRMFYENAQVFWSSIVVANAEVERVTKDRRTGQGDVLKHVLLVMIEQGLGLKQSPVPPDLEAAARHADFEGSAVKLRAKVKIDGIKKILEGVMEAAEEAGDSKIVAEVKRLIG